MSTHGVLRYQRHKQPNVIKRPKEPDHTISAMQYEFPETQGFIPPGWTAHWHPEGALYFMHVESKMFTEVNMCNKDICEDIEDFKHFLFSELQDEIEKRGLSWSLKHDEVQLVLEPRVDECGVAGYTATLMHHRTVTVVYGGMHQHYNQWTARCVHQ
ncbi:hypothetical protein PAXINDRAFT_103598 [Paxillus involutus ATCC 200175]|uniref:Uncharacterized protein n=1 Tax=Paxillus involutus ATCC 200175 TaxID=664439 RepID=A0A0C9SMB5_PAXIN|nr:hypothetical protein PAXINDRAFT_103598 [Paxillus involutus ATCC 200175]